MADQSLLIDTAYDEIAQFERAIIDTTKTSGTETRTDSTTEAAAAILTAAADLAATVDPSEAAEFVNVASFFDKDAEDEMDALSGRASTKAADKPVLIAGVPTAVPKKILDPEVQTCAIALLMRALVVRCSFRPAPGAATARAIGFHAQCACLLSLQMGSLN
jgi:hypothetical protein